MPISVSGSTITFTATSTQWAIAKSTVTTTEATKAVSYSFTVARRPLRMRVGTSDGGRQIIDDITLSPGAHLITFVPGAGTYYVQFTLQDEGVATLSDFARVAPGLLTLPTPWATADLPSIRYEQSADVVWMYCEGHQTRVLERRGNTSWSLRLFQPINGPFDSPNSGPITLTPSAQTGTATLTASQPLFKTQDVGQLIRLTHTGQFRTANFTAAAQVTNTIRVTGVGTDRSFVVSISGTFSATVVLQRSIGNEISWVDINTYTSGTTATISDALDNQIVYYRLRCSAYTSGTAVSSLTYSRGVTDGYAIIHTVTADNSVGVDIFATLGSTVATAEWSFGAWGGRGGWPYAGAVHDGRHWVARADRVWASESDDYESFALGTLDSDAISRRMATGEINSARWVESAGRLLIGTAGAEIENRSNQLEDPVTPTNLVTRARSTRGSANAQAAKMDTSVVFIARSTQRLYRLAFSQEENGYAPQDLTRLNRDVAGTGFKEVAIQVDPEPRILVVRDDGQMAVMLYAPDEQCYAWFRIVTDGAFESVCVTPGTPEDYVYVVVRRTIGGVTKRYVERFALEGWDDSRDAWRVHSGLSYSGTPVSAFSGLGHLEGKSVAIWADGRVMAPRTVVGGSIALDWAVSKAIVGLPYTGRYRSSKLAYGAQAGSALTMQKKVGRLGLLLYRTPGGCLSWGPSFDRMDRLPSHRQGDAMDSPLSLWTGDTTQTVIAMSDLDARVCISMPEPGPAEVLGMVPLVETNERA